MGISLALCWGYRQAAGNKNMLTFSQPAENNKIDICDRLCEILGSSRHLLEIGSGTGQHATYMAARLPYLIWQTTELAENLINVRARLTHEAPENVRHPIELDVSSLPWLVTSCDAIYSANTVHIMSWAHVEQLFRGVGATLEKGGFLCLYGPYKYNGDFTTPSNQRFDQWLKGNDAVSGIRDFEAVDELAKNHGLALQKDYAMPANNQLLVWRRGE
jgi:cyclopropane fatty-acyl-phospholipid synthase-like methyltransferase